MSTKWVVTVATERVALDQSRTAEITFTVTNPGGMADRVVFDASPSVGADEAWFTVDEPQRLVRGGASVSFLMKVAVPPEAAPGTYEVQGRFYSADAAPEESSVLSPRVMLEVPAEPEPEQRRPWWWLVAAAAVVLILLVGVGVLVFGGDDGDQTPVPTATPTPSPTATSQPELVMPDLREMSEQEALAALDELGLTVRPIRYRHNPDEADRVLVQSPEPELVVSPETLVDLIVAVDLAAPDITAPTGVPMLAADADRPTVEWDPGRSPARTWQVSWQRERCVLTGTFEWAQVHDCYFPGSDSRAVIEASSFLLPVSFAPAVAGSGSGAVYHTGWVWWQVAAVDDFGVAGPASEGYFRVAVLP